jgi:putative holliday junction resolvase
MRCMGVDYGSRRVGCAISDELGMVASPLTTLDVTGLRDAIEQVADLCARREAGRVIVGLPLNMNGSEGAMAALTREFAARLQARTGVAVFLVDERFSSKMAENVLIEADMSRRGRKGVIDRMAAQIVLQSYLDGMPGIPAGSPSVPPT